jgi:hypothetical protein
MNVGLTVSLAVCGWNLAICNLFSALLLKQHTRTRGGGVKLHLLPSQLFHQGIAVTGGGGTSSINSYIQRLPN